MSIKSKQFVVALLAALFLVSLVFVQGMEVARKRREAGLATAHIAVPASSQSCNDCHEQATSGIIAHWEGSTHARKGVGCFECHRADAGDADAFTHYGQSIATIVTPRDCARCHPTAADEFQRSHHAAAGNILASLDNRLAEVVEGAREPFGPHSPTLGRESARLVNGMASVELGCQQCHGSKVAFEATGGGTISVDDLKPDANGRPTNADAVARIVRNADGRPKYTSGSWPNTGIGRINVDGSLGSCSACHSRHDFSPRRARQPENCGKCHLGPDHPQKEIYDESKHGVAFADLRERMNLDSPNWELGRDYSAAPTCATCHMSGNSLNGGKVTHDPGERISWTNRPPVSLVMDTDIAHGVVKETDPVARQKLVADSWQAKRERMKQVCSHCHSPGWITGFYQQYDDLVTLYNEKYGKPGSAIMKALHDQKLLTAPEFDEPIEWTWYLLWHHEGRRARHGAAMMAPDYTHWHGMFEVAQRFYVELIPQVREVLANAEAAGKHAEVAAVRQVLDEILARPEHSWQEQALALGGAKND